MKIVLVGADIEENLGVGMIAAVAEAAGHLVTVVPFSEARERGEVMTRVLAQEPGLVGLSIQFQHRAAEFLGLGEELRARGFTGHLTAGGQFPTLAWQELLAAGHGLDSIVLHDGEETFALLIAALEDGAPLAEVAGLALRDASGRPTRTRGRRLVEDLDQLPFPRRYRQHSRHLGIPFIPIMGGRGCWGRCSFCSITSTYRDARRHGGGKMLRHRSPGNVAAEMSELLRRAGGRAVFCFHDDTFLLPRPEASLRRVRAIRDALEPGAASRVGLTLGLVGKCRPDSLTPELARELGELGVVRLYVGVENTSEAGLAHLGRGVRAQQVRDALAACRQAGIFVCYNLLIFEPGARLGDIAENIAFIREHPQHPVNFGRAEPYFGTPLQLGLAAQGRLSGDHLGHGYRIEDDRTELLFRICAAVFRQRNYDADGVHNRVMGVGYAAKLLEHFFEPDGDGRQAAVLAEAAALTRRVALESAELLEQALALARDAELGDRESIERATTLLGLRVAAADGRRHRELDRFYSEAELVAARSVERGERGEAAPPQVALPARSSRRTAQILQGVALASLLAAGACDDRPPVVDPDAGPLDYRRPRENMVVDPDVRPLDRPRDNMVVDPDVQPLDRPPRRDAGPDQMIVDPPPPPHDAGRPQARLIDRWRDTAAAQTTRTPDLPLFDPPGIELAAVRDGRGIEVRVLGGPGSISARWEGDGEILGSGTAVRWSPRDENDQLRVGVRTRGGVAVAALRARDVPGRRS